MPKKKKKGVKKIAWPPEVLKGNPFAIIDLRWRNPALHKALKGHRGYIVCEVVSHLGGGIQRLLLPHGVELPGISRELPKSTQTASRHFLDIHLFNLEIVSH